MIADFRRWLVHHQPSKVRVETLDGERTVMIGTARSKWRDATEACAGALRAEALTDKGETLAVWENPDAEQFAKGPRARADDEPRSELAELARIITESNDAAVSRCADMMRSALEHNNQLVNLVMQRLVGVEQAWHELLLSQRESTPESDDPNAPLVKEIITAAAPALAAMAIAGGAAKTPAPNGKG